MDFNNITIKTFGGVLAGVTVGAFIFKSKNFLVLTALGVGGGMLANHIVKMMDKDKATNEYINNVKKDIEDSLVEEKASFYGVNKEMLFEKQLGYNIPINNEMIEDKPSNYADIDLSFS